jgi:hypothetical protein
VGEDAGTKRKRDDDAADKDGAECAEEGEVVEDEER